MARPEWEGARPFRIDAKASEARDTASLALVPLRGGAPPPFVPGQFLTLEVPVPGRAPLVRCYSLSNAPGEPAYRITVKAEAKAAGEPSASGWLVREARPGGVLAVRAPAGNFTLGPSEDPAVLVAGGIGITPFASMLLHLARTGARRPVHVFWGARRGDEAPLRREVEAAARAAGARLHVLYSQPGPDDVPGRDHERAGRVTLDVLRELVPPGERPYDFFLCGPPPLLRDLSAGLGTLGVPESKVHVEVFGGAAVREVARATRRLAPGPAHEVVFARSGKKAAWDPAAGSLMGLAERAGVPIPYACAAGRCGTCLTRLVEGEVAYPVPPGFGALFEGWCLPCVGLPRSRVVLDA